MNRKAYIAQLERELASARALNTRIDAKLRLAALCLAASVAGTGSSPSYVIGVARQLIDFIGATS